MRKPIRAQKLTDDQLRMLDIGAPVVIACRTATDDVVNVRLQSANLDRGTDEAGGWVVHGVHVAVMPNGVDYGA